MGQENESEIKIDGAAGAAGQVVESAGPGAVETWVNKSAYSSIWFHGAATEVAIAQQNLFTKIEIFVNVGDEDPHGNVVGDAGNNNITINLAGVYNVRLGASVTNAGGGAVEFNICVGIVLATPLVLSDATNATPIVVTTTVDHGLKTGDQVRIAGVTGNTNANGDFYITRLSGTTFSLQDFDHANVAGNGAYTGAPGGIAVIYPGNFVIERIVSNTQLGRGQAEGDYVLAVGDVLEAIAMNRDGVDNLEVQQIAFRVGSV